MKRREYLTGLAGLGALSAATGQVAGDSGVRRLSLSSAVGDDTHHPGAPRFAPLGVTFYDRMYSDFSNDHAGGKDRDNFAPRIVGDPQQDPENYSPDDFSWSIKSRPDDSTATIEYRPPDNGTEQYTPDPAPSNVAEFNPDVPGRYVLELEAPDGTHEQVLHIFPEDGGQGGPPRISIEGEYDSDAEEFVLESNPKLAPNSSMAKSDIFVAWLADTRDALATEDIQIGEGSESWTARIAKSALGGETCRVHAAPNDTNATGFTDTVVLNPNENAVEYPNRPPEWIQNGIMYQIFPRSFMGPPEDGEWPLENSNAHFAGFESKLDYLEDLNVDVIWFTPTVPSESGNWKPQNADAWDGSGGNRFKFVGGGPHGYDALSYFQKAEDLTSEYSYSEYADEPWPWEDGYDPENNAREAARQSAMEEFKSFLDAAHERDIKVCLDFVINHGGRHHPLFQDTIAEKSDFRPSGWTYKGIASHNKGSKYFDWFTRQDAPIETDSGQEVEPAPAAVGFANPPLRVMPQWNYANVALREHILAAAKHWAEMGVDAFRCDIAYGVPHSFWKEVREVVQAENSEFMMLDETIPNDPTFAENEFDMHFDTADFMNASHSVAEGGDPMQLYDAVAKRKNEGWPDHTLIANSTENHDEFRLYDVASDSNRDNPAAIQRAGWAAGVMLPGVPFIYYGQERLISEYGYERFDYDGTGEDYRTGDGDVQPGNPARAFMNWEENGDTVPQDHLQFYKDVTQFYKDTEIVKPHAELKGAWYQSDSNVMGFGRSMETEDGEQNVIVLVNFSGDTAEIDLLPGASTTDMFTGSDISTGSEGPAVTVEVDTLAVLETDSLFSLGERIAQIDDSAGDDTGPGGYTYPTGDAYTDGVFDITDVSIHTTATDLQFRVAIDGDLATDDDGNITAQHLQFYIRNPEAENGATEGRAGTNVTFEEAYQYRLLANGEDGAWIEDYEGTKIADGSVIANPVADEIVVEMPKDVLDAGIRAHYVAPLMFGYDGDADGSVMSVAAEAGEMVFGGAETPGMAPRVIDMTVPSSTSQSDALAYGSDSMATLPYTSLVSDYELIGEGKDATDDDNGPGNYQYPSGPEGEVYDGMWDITKVNVSESRSRVQFEYVLASEIENVWTLPGGFSQQFPQVYIRDPDADDDTVATTTARNGINANFQDPYHYRIVVHGEGTQQVEAFELNSDDEVASTIATTDVNLAVDGNTIRFDVPKDAIGGSPTDKELVSLMAPYDGFGAGGVRQGFAGQPGEYVIGTDGKSTENAPRVMDMITPGDVSQAQALAYTESSMAEIPFAAWEDAYVQSTTIEIEDPEGDDNGPGTYTYPTNSAFTDGCFDVSKVEILNKTATWDVTVHIDGELTNPWGGDAGFSVQAIQMYLQDPNAADDTPQSLTARTGMTSSFQEPYHYRIAVHGENGPKVVEDANGQALAEGIETTASQDDSTITFKVPKSPFATGDIRQMKMAMVMMSKDGFGSGDIRQNFGESNAEYGFGGADPNAAANAPRVLDLVGPDAVVDQGDALSYSADSGAVLPLYPVSSLESGVPPEGALTAVAAPGPTVFSTAQAQLDASNSSDPNGQALTFQWEQVSGPSAEIADGDTVQPTITAPDVDEETTATFEVTVTNEDGDTATAQTTVTIRPQSENEAPIAKTDPDKTVTAGDTVPLQAAGSEDPNGGTLSYQWTQTAGPSVDLAGADSFGPAFTAPQVSEETTLTFELTVSDGQGKSATDTINVTVQPGEGSMTTTMGQTETDEPATSTTESGSGTGPGFGVVSGALGTAGGIAYAAKRLLGEDAAQPEDVAVEDVDDGATVEEEEE